MTVSLTIVERVVAPRSVIEETQAHLRSAGVMGLEGMALWAGALEDNVFHIRAAIVPQQQGHRTEHGLAVSVPGAELHRINMWLHRNRMRLIAQIHSHPTEAFHSDTDDRYAIATALGSLSIVVPDFAVRPFRLDDCAAYRLSPRPWWHFSDQPHWRALGYPELSRTLQIAA
ncbi:Mov34/MPN/PAD-1 family protein [Phenylobacterium sp. J426]|uniref:Mov34/MPN/PAD-1 family protein n=1 Tax=Phenylobacterium sp. J426 TaxID=2898439 RepID=UPI002150797D|nr:Mov34/MPN/PAD-1 family protein [Phenylobacterium sp. J426]MCR5876886.1 Mov34/MPN/PAD-1 family protein [Phenylobacterium sp. J426]